MRFSKGCVSLLALLDVLVVPHAFLFDCTYPFIQCRESDFSSLVIDSKQNFFLKGSESDDQLQEVSDNTNAPVARTTSLSLSNTYTFAYTRQFTNRMITQQSEANMTSSMTPQGVNEVLNNITNAIDVVTRMGTLDLTTEESVQAVNRAIDTLASSLNQSQPYKANTEALVNLFDEAVKYVELMDWNQTKNFLLVSSTALVGSLKQDSTASQTTNVIEKVEGYVFAATESFLQDEEIVNMDLGSVDVTLCKSENEECQFRSEDANFESISEGGLLVTFIKHKALAQDTLPVDSVIASASAQNASRNQVSIPVQFTFKHNEATDAKTTSSCVFLNVTSAEWSSEGCNPIFFNSTHTECFCNHTTNFAILFLHSDVKLTKADKFWFNLMTYLGCGVSITALIATMSIFIVLRLHRAERVILLWNLCFCLCSAQLILVAGTTAQVGTPGCQAIAVLLHFFFTASFSWMLMEGIHLYMKASNARGGRYKFRIILASGWILPICVVAVSMAIGLDQYGTGNACWLSMNNGFVWAFIGPSLGIILINSVVLIFVIKVFLGLKSISKTSEGERIKKATKAVFFLMPLLGMTWIFGLLAFDEATKWFLYLFCICNSLQGLAIFILQCAKNDDVRKAFFKKYRRTFVSIGSYSSGETGSSNKTNDSYMTSDHPKGLPTIAKW